LNPTPYAIGLMPGAVIDGNIPYGTGDAALKVINTSASDGTALFGQATAISGDTAGVYGLAASPNGAGVWGETEADNAKGVVGYGRDPCPNPDFCSSGVLRNASGVVGEAFAFGTGVWGRSKYGNGVYGETSETNTFDVAGVLGRSTGNGGLGVKGEANVGNGWGVYGVSAAGAGVVGQSTSGYAMQALGHAAQSLNADGWVKAMVSVDPGRPSGQQIVQCFNSQLPASAATTPPCGMTATGFRVGGWDVDFGFDVTGRFVALTIHFTDLCFQPGPHCAIAGQTSYPGETGVDVWIKYAGDGQLTNAPFTLILY
jgi:hypothetical protein